MGASLYFNLSVGRGSTQACLQCIFKQVGKHKAEIHLGNRKRRRRVKLHGKGNIIFPVKHSVVSGNSVNGRIITQIQSGFRDAFLCLGKICFQCVPFSAFCEGRECVDVMPHVMAYLACFFNRCL